LQIEDFLNGQDRDAHSEREKYNIRCLSRAEEFCSERGTKKSIGIYEQWAPFFLVPMLADDDDEMLSLQCAQLPTYPLNKYEKNGKAHGLL
jgi:hypothetical protein